MKDKIKNIKKDAPYWAAFGIVAAQVAYVGAVAGKFVYDAVKDND